MTFKQLPSNVKPLNYEVELFPNLNTFVFTGCSSISIQILETTDSIELNCLDIKISNAKIIAADGTTLLSKNITYCLQNEIVKLEFHKICPQTATLLLNFEGELNDKMKGFYRSKYFTKEGIVKYAAVTQFEATDARRCFPCWDEPAIKATFDIKLKIPSTLIALSNMPVKSNSKLDDNLQIISFERSPIMSTYLVAVVIGEFDYVEDFTNDGVVVRVYTPLGKKEQGRFALKVATKVLPYYNDYFKISYPLPKIDLIAIADFAAGAMENWGLVTYRESFVLVDSENTSLIRKQSIALTVGHELAHQWFGNLVTMEWWTHLWLNEGYASFIEFLCVDHIFPEYHIWTQFVTDMHTKALELDALKNSHPIEVVVHHPSEIDEIFDEISYNKGACVIRMLHNYLGDSNFRKGMNSYLTKHQFKNTKTEDLWAAFEESSGHIKRVTEIMSTWVKQKGYPVLSVSIIEKKNGKFLAITQDKFTADGSLPNKNYFWEVPVSISTAKNPLKVEKSFIMNKKYLEISIDEIDCESWIKLNPGTISYYRTSYTYNMLMKFVPSIQDMSLPALDRLGLIDDSFAMVQAGHMTTVDFLKLIDSYRNETNFTVWNAITNSMSKLQTILSNSRCIQKFNEFCQNLYSPVCKRLGWESMQEETHLDMLLRSLVLNRLITFSCNNTINEACKRFKSHMDGTCLLPADLRSACYKAILKTGDEETFENMLELYRCTDLHEEKDRISRALGSLNIPTLLIKVIDFAMSDEVRSQDTVFIITAVSLNPIGRDLAWKFFKENSDILFQKYQGGYLVARLIKYLTENFSTFEMANEIKDYFERHEFPGTERTVNQSIETINLNARWLQRDMKEIEKYLLEK